ncbi:MAG: hypothetical protein Q4D38_00055 [Planctomycetia bacterium]|nr:hypothetical protein [Planctomycetia bacterium]
MNPMQYLDETVYNPLFMRKVAEYTGIQFNTQEELVQACNMALQLEAHNMQKAGGYSPQAAAQRGMQKSAAYATSPEIRQLANRPDIAQCLDALSW